MKIYYDRENKRLVYVGKSASPDFWDKHWETENLRERGKAIQARIGKNRVC